jgi:hypothetical protein
MFYTFLKFFTEYFQAGSMIYIAVNAFNKFSLSTYISNLDIISLNKFLIIPLNKFLITPLLQNFNKSILTTILFFCVFFSNFFFKIIFLVVFERVLDLNSSLIMKTFTKMFDRSPILLPICFISPYIMRINSTKKKRILPGINYVEFFVVSLMVLLILAFRKNKSPIVCFLKSLVKVLKR